MPTSKSQTKINNFFTQVSFSDRGTFATPEEIDSFKLVLVRGLPGSGKSTIARALQLADFYHVEADMFFEFNGEYKYDRNKIREAHEWCIDLTQRILKGGRKVVVSNTFTRLIEMEPYMSMSPSIRVIQATGCWPNVHGVQDQRIKEMASRWECFDGIWPPVARTRVQ